jgi:predicted nucleic acid-binding protein
VFLDTSALVAVANRRERRHIEAEKAWKRLLKEGRQFVTTNIVLIELGDGLSRLNQRSIALKIRDLLLRTSQIVHLTPVIETEAWKLFSERSDKEWGLTDCISMTVMNQMNIEEVFTLDHHFQQAGFQTVPS